MSERSADRVGEHIGSYRLIRLLGKGGYADVYLGEHRYHNTLAAIKLFHRSTSDIDLEEIINEARTIAQLEHPHIIHVFECSVDNDYPFLVMSYAPNGTLRQRHPRGSHLSCAQIVPYVQQVAEALQYAHEHKLVHRDVKPENMLIDEDGKILLSDFGLVTFARSTGTQTTGDMRGTVTYMAPEQLHGKPRTASDQYALGIVVYEWLSGKRPFNGSFAEIASQHILAAPPPLRTQVPDLPPAVEQVIFKALEKHPSDRYKNVIAFAQALQQASLSTVSTRSFSTSDKHPATRTLIAPTDNDFTPHQQDASDFLLSSPIEKAKPTRRLEDQPTQLDVQTLWSYEDSAPRATSTSPAEQPTQLDTRPNIPKETGKDHALIRRLATPTRNKMLKTTLILLGLLLVIGGSLALSKGLSAPSQPARKQPGTSSGMITSIVNTPAPTKTVKVAGHSTPTHTAPTPTTLPTATSAPSTPTQAPTPTPKPSPTPKPTPTPSPTPTSLLPITPLPTIVGGLLP